MRFIIVNKADLAILSSYESDHSRLGTGEFGGPWNDENIVMHLQVPERLLDVATADLRVVYEMGVTAVAFVPCQCDQGKPVFQEVYTKDGTLIVDAKGYPLYAQLYTKLESNGMVYNVKKLGE